MNNGISLTALLTDTAERLRLRAFNLRQGAEYSDDPRRVREDHADANALAADAAALIRAAEIMTRETAGGVSGGAA